jgi:DNA-binding XRE family transcriptional regulator
MTDVFDVEVTNENEKTVREDFGNKIYTLRKKLGLSSDAMGRVVGVTGGTICNWESTRYFMSQQGYDMLVEAYPSLKTKEIEDLITIENKPGGRPTGAPAKYPENRKKPRPPTHPKVMNAPKQPAKPNVDKQTDIANVLVNSKTLVAMLALDLSNKYGREEIIKRLRAAGASDAFILDVIHEALP